MDLSHLNEVQRQAVTHTKGACMVIAGAGSGKTSVLTHRIAYLLKEKKVDSLAILALTFTNKAAQEMSQRIEKIVGHVAKKLWLGTFHSVFARILRREATSIGYPSSFTIFDTIDSKSLLKAIVQSLKLDDKVYRPDTLLNRISGAKNQLISAQEYVHDAVSQAADERAGRPRLGEIFLKYVDRCFKAGIMDFDDLLFNTHRLFKQCPDILHKYQDRFQYILIDEFQDTNTAQYAILRELALLHKNVCVVGDDAQSIYAFRGADIRNILTIRKDYPNLRVIKLEQNYRSTQSIVSAANSIIRHNQSQLEKKVWTSNASGEPLGLVKAATDTEEGRLVASSIFEIRASQQIAYSSFAILYRTNSQSRPIEEALRRLGMPYRIVGSMSFYERKEVRDLLAYLRLLVNPNDEEALKRIINVPKRGIGMSSVEKLVMAAEVHGIPLWEAVCNSSRFLPSRAVSSIREFATMIQRVASKVAYKDAHEISSEIAQRSGLLKELHEDRTMEGMGRYANVQELLNGIKEFTTNPERTDLGLPDFLQEVALMTNVDEAQEVTTDSVKLMTIHAAKGLEFTYVYVVGMEEELFPSPLMLRSQADLEEERRLFYVAVTRARQKVVLTYALSRYRFGRLKYCEPSRFLAEIDPAYLQFGTRCTWQNDTNTDYTRRLVRSVRKNSQKGQFTQRDRVALNTSQPGNSFQFVVGTQVEHPQFGIGEVLQLDTTSKFRKAKVRFTKFGEKTLLLSFAKLSVVPECSS